MDIRPHELQLEGCVIELACHAPAGIGAKRRYLVLAVSGPYAPDPDWCARPHLGGYSLTVDCVYMTWVPESRRLGWINEVFVEDGRIYAHPWRDEIEVVEVGSSQLSLF